MFRMLVIIFCSSFAHALLAGEAPFSVYPFAIPNDDQQRFDQYRERWRRLTGFEYSGLHWNQFIAVFINQEEAVFRHNYLTYLLKIDEDEDDEDEDEDGQSKAAYKTYSPGTIILKENYTSHQGKPAEPLTLTIMIKHQKGYDPNHGDWEYLQTDIAGRTMLRGNSQDSDVQAVCASCHSNIAERDYIFSTFYNK